ncbi:MAG TPA: hypothetical protein VGB85_10945 [Nannocystis sp.]
MNDFNDLGELGDFLKDTRDHLDRALAESGAMPDLAASVARARELDPSAVSERAVDETAALAPVAQLRPKARRNTPVPENMSDRAVIDPFTAALRDQLEADLARQIHRGAIASASGPAVAPPAPIDLGRRRRTIVATVLALAAAVLITLGLGGAFEAQPARPGALPGAAALAGQRNAEAAAEAARPPRAVVVQAPPVPEDSPAAPVPEDSPEIGPAPDAQDDLAPARPRPRRPVTPEPAAAPAEDPLAALDREAQLLWQQGKLREAADKFAEIVKRAPGSRAAEAAYGDLFALEHRLGGDAVTLWRAYLRQFPRGRYADDARAGVCRRQPAAERGECWAEYLAAHPDGAHRREAEQATPAP